METVAAVVVVVLMVAALGLDIAQLDGQVTLSPDINGRDAAHKLPYDVPQQTADGALQSSVGRKLHRHLFELQCA